MQKKNEKRNVHRHTYSNSEIQTHRDQLTKSSYGGEGGKVLLRSFIGSVSSFSFLLILFFVPNNSKPFGFSMW